MGRQRSMNSQSNTASRISEWDASRSQPPAAPLVSGNFLIISGEGQTYAETEADECGWRKSAGTSSNGSLWSAVQCDHRRSRLMRARSGRREQFFNSTG